MYIEKVYTEIAHNKIVQEKGSCNLKNSITTYSKKATFEKCTFLKSVVSFNRPLETFCCKPNKSQ